MKEKRWTVHFYRISPSEKQIACNQSIVHTAFLFCGQICRDQSELQEPKDVYSTFWLYHLITSDWKEHLEGIEIPH